MAGDYVDGDVIFDTVWLTLKRAVEGNGILTGLAGSPGPGALQTTWAAGTFYALNVAKVIGSPVPLTHSAGHATFDRWDLIHGDASGLAKIEGTPLAAPAMPDIPAGSIIIGLVYIPATTATITAGMIRDFAFVTPLQDHIQDSTIHFTKPIAEADVTFQNGGHDHSGGAGGQKVDYGDLLNIPSEFAPSVHGASKHTDVLRRIVPNVFGGRYENLAANPPTFVNEIVNVGVGNRYVAGWKWPTGIDSDPIYVSFRSPREDWASGTMTIKLLMCRDNNPAANFVMFVNHIVGSLGNEYTIPNLPASFPAKKYTLNHSVTAYLAQEFSTETPAISNVNDRTVTVLIRRLGNDGADVYTGSVFLIGLIAEFTANE